MKRKTRFGLMILAGLLSPSGVVLAGRPLAIDDAGPVDSGQFEFEAGAAYEHDSDCKHWDVPFGLTYGLIPGIEVGAGFGGQFEERTDFLEDTGTAECVREDGIGDLVLGAKWQPIKSCPLGARHALAPSVKLPTADDDKELGSGKTDYDLTWIASRSLGEKAGAHLNLGYSWIGGPDDDVLHYGVALDYQIMYEVQWVGEVFADRELADGAAIVAQYNTGLRWNPVESLTVDIAGGSKISGEAPDYTGTVGLTWAFGFKNNESK
jgi:hypothetical protein